MSIQLRNVNTSYRLKRLKLFSEFLSKQPQNKKRVRILDVGGTVAYWQTYEDLWSMYPLEITTINLKAEHSPDPRIQSVAGDACQMQQFADREFDVVHSNSVIEHIGRWNQMRQMAKEISRLAPAYFVQTPSAWCPIEPHFRMPFIHWLPEPVRLLAVLNFYLGFYDRAKDVDTAMQILEDAVLLDMRRMRALFPDARIIKETLGGVLTKSYIAVRNAGEIMPDMTFQPSE